MKGHGSAMAQRANGKNSREEYRRIQERKRSKVLKRTNARTVSDDPYNTMRSGNVERTSTRAERQRRKRERRKQKRSTARGMFLLVVQVIALMALMLSLFSLNALPTEYLLIIGCILILAAGITLGTQLSTKKQRIAGKVFSLLITTIMIGATYLVIKTDNVFNMVANSSNYKVDQMVVAVLKDDEAETLADAANYRFGVQYAKDTKNMEDAVSTITAEMSTPINTEELGGISEQGKALASGAVQAIVYNEGYTEILSSSVEGFEDKIKVIYKYDVKTELQDLTIDMAVNEESFAVFISGIDVYGDISTTSNSDVNIIAVVNPKSHQVLLITTPRDYYVPIPGISEGRNDKLTHAGIYGVQASMNTLEALYELEIPFYTRINFTSLVDIVDAMGGVDVELGEEEAITVGRHTGIRSEYVDLQVGMNHLNGEQALMFARERKGYLTGDNQRGKNQQTLITAMVKKMISPTMIIKANGLLDAVAGKVDTNMTPDQIRSLIKQQMRTNGKWKFTSMSAEG